MPVPVQVTFRDMSPSNAVASHVERRAAKLETFFDRIVKCHVVVGAPHRHHRTGQRYHVRIDLHVPGKELVVTRNLEDSQLDLHAAVDGAFGDAERVLEEHSRKIDEEKRTPRAGAAHGVVSKLFSDRGYGFIEGADGQEIYFHQNSVLNGKFGRLSIGARVRYAEEDGEKGPQASTVHMVGDA